MRTRPKQLLTGMLWATMQFAFATNASAPKTFKSPILPTELTSLEGQAIRPDADTTRLVILDFFTSWCVPCRAESKKLDRIQRRFRRDDLEVIGVDEREDKERAAQFVSATKVTFPVLLDSGTLESRYKVYMFPVVLVFDRQSHLLYRFEGENKNFGEFIAGLLQH